MDPFWLSNIASADCMPIFAQLFTYPKRRGLPIVPFHAEQQVSKVSK